MGPRDIARVLGSRGGRARAARLPAADRRRIAVQGGLARRESLRTARRIGETLSYAAAAAALRQAPPVVRLRAFSGRLPRIDSE